MSLIKQIGITGCPGGATHYAARLFGLPHESGIRQKEMAGTVDYLLAVPAERWPSAGYLQRRYPKQAFSELVTFETRLTVLRDPMMVVQTNLGQRGIPFLKQMATIIDVAPSSENEPIPSWATRIFLAWYRQCLEWSDGRFFRAEDPPEAVEDLVPYDGPIVIPAAEERGHPAGARVKREVLEAALSPEARQDMANFMQEYYA